MIKSLFSAAALTLVCLSGPVLAQTAADDELAWVSDQDDDFFYLAYSVPESDRFAIAFVCAPKDKKTFFALREKPGGPVKVDDKFALTLKVGDTKSEIQAETSFDANEDMLRSVAAMKADDPLIQALATAQTLEMTRHDKTVSYPLTEIEPRLREFQSGCGLKK